METIGSVWLLSGFLLFVVAMLALDLGIFHRKAHAVGVREAAAWSVFWILLALTFNGGLWYFFGAEKGVQFLAGYLVEKSLSVDNLFVFVVVFAALKIPPALQHRVLFWGILSALVLRGAMILAGAALLERFHFLIYVFGGFLVLTGWKLFRAWQSGHVDHGSARGLTLLRRWIPSTDRFDGQKFFTRVDGRRLATPLLLALLLVEFTDVVFALDSIPAIFGITRDPFLVFTSNVFAILGLRSLYFLLAGMVDRFAYLKVGLSAVLVFVGSKMVMIDVVKVPPAVSLGIIALLLGGSVAVSWMMTRGERELAAVDPGSGSA